MRPRRNLACAAMGATVLLAASPSPSFAAAPCDEFDPAGPARSIVVALNGYVLLGGADFGGGVWDLLASGPRRDSQRALIAERVAPRITNRDEPAARVALRLRGAGRALRLPIATTVPAERRYHHRRGRVFGRYRECGAGR